MIHIWFVREYERRTLYQEWSLSVHGADLYTVLEDAGTLPWGCMPVSKEAWGINCSRYDVLSYAPLSVSKMTSLGLYALCPAALPCRICSHWLWNHSLVSGIAQQPGTIFAFGDNQNMSYWVQGLSRFFPQPLHSSSTMTHPPCKIAQRRGEATFLSNSKVLHQADPECHHLTEPQSRLPDTLEDSERLQAQHIWVPEPSGLWHNISSNNKEIRIGIDQTDPALLR